MNYPLKINFNLKNVLSVETGLRVPFLFMTTPYVICKKLPYFLNACVTLCLKTSDSLFGINESLWNLLVIIPEWAFNARVRFGRP